MPVRTPCQDTASPFAGRRIRHGPSDQDGPEPRITFISAGAISRTRCRRPVALVRLARGTRYLAPFGGSDCLCASETPLPGAGLRWIQGWCGRRVTLESRIHQPASAGGEGSARTFTSWLSKARFGRGATLDTPSRGCLSCPCQTVCIQNTITPMTRERYPGNPDAPSQRNAHPAPIPHQAMDKETEHGAILYQ